MANALRSALPTAFTSTASIVKFRVPVKIVASWIFKTPKCSAGLSISSVVPLTVTGASRESAAMRSKRSPSTGGSALIHVGNSGVFASMITGDPRLPRIARELFSSRRATKMAPRSGTPKNVEEIKIATKPMVHIKIPHKTSRAGNASACESARVTKDTKVVKTRIAAATPINDDGASRHDRTTAANASTRYPP